MLKAYALARLRLNLQPTSEPTLTEQELDDLLTAHAMEDAEGVAPEGVGWVGTWDLRGASRRGWLLKAAKVVAEVNSAGDGTQYSLSDVHEHCITMASRFSTMGSISLG